MPSCIFILFLFQEAVSDIFLNISLLQFKLIIFYPIFCGHGEELSSLLPLVVSVLEDYSCGSLQSSLVQTEWSLVAHTLLFGVFSCPCWHLDPHLSPCHGQCWR